MSQHNMYDWSAMAKAFSAPFAELHALNTKVVEQIAKDSIESVSHNLGAAIKHAQASFKTKEAEDFVKLQMDYMTDLSAKSISYGKDLAKLFEGAFNDYRHWGESKSADLLKKAGLSTECGGSKK